MISAILSRLVILVFGTLYPAYASYKAVRTKNLKEYVKWMMYWIVFALFTCTETFTDVFLSWFPFYYEVKIVLVLWLLSPATKGSSILYRKFVHPALCRREQEIDEYIAKAKDQGYHTVLNLGTKGVNYATTVIMQTAIKGGGGLVQQLRKSYSLSDLSECDPRDERGRDEADDVLTEPQVIRRAPARSGYSTRRSASESNSRSPMYFPEVDVDVRSARSSRSDEPDFSHIKSSEDISSGYSSADNSGASLTRTSSVGAGARVRPRQARTTVTTIKRPQAAEDSEVIIEELHDDNPNDYVHMPSLENVPSPLFLSHTDPPFVYQYMGNNQVRIVQMLGYQLDSRERILYDDLGDQINKSKEQIVATDALEKYNEAISKQDLKLCDTNKNEPDNNNNESQIDKPCQDSLLPLKQITIETKEDTGSISEGIIKTSSNNIVIDDANIHHATSTSTIVSDEESDNNDMCFGTPDQSPKSKKKSKGRYGKDKAPLPPSNNNDDDVHISNKNAASNISQNNFSDTSSTVSQKSLNDIVSALPNKPFKESGLLKVFSVNPIAEKKRRHKSKSPGTLIKSNSSAIGKLLQLPIKLAFWNKNNDPPKQDNASISSDDLSRRSSSIDIIDPFQSCSDLSNLIIDKEVVLAEDQISFKDATDLENESFSQDIIEKSDALQKLIEAKLESHPEYKINAINEEIPTTSKTTDV